MMGYLRIGNKRQGIKSQVRSDDEWILSGDRSNKVLGNPIELKDPTNDEARLRVIKEYKVILEKDCQEKGPIWQEIEWLADMIIKGEKILLLCWCVPKLCHLNLIKEKVYNLIFEKTGEKPLE